MGSGENRHVNYVYFAILFVFLSFLHIYQIFLIDEGSGIHRTFYILYAVGQCVLEVGVLVLIGNFLVKRFPKILNPLFILFTFVLFLVHIIDFPLLRIMDISIWYGLDFIFDESLENFIEILHATNIPIKNWIMGGIAILILPVLGVLFFQLTGIVARKKPFNFSYASAALIMLAIFFFFFMFDFKTGKLASLGDDSRFLKALPWKTTLFAKPYPILPVKGALKAIPSEEECLQRLSRESFGTARRPNIFLFVIESLREDFITPENSPFFSRLREDSLSFDYATSATTCTQGSWFSLFQARYPFYWGKMRPGQWSLGSLPLYILKQAGYKIHLYSAASFGFYNMDEMLFGKERYLPDTMHLCSRNGTEEPYESDAEVFAQLQKDMELMKNKEGQVFLVFLDSTHFDYSWPKRDSLQFTPVVEQIDYLKVACSKENIEGIKNRYRNAIYYLDGLFGQFQKKLETMAHGDRAMIVVTGDHGEEFYEQGQIFHASHLSDMQTHVPIYFSLRRGANPFIPPRQRFCSHLDIFPTILDHVFGDDRFASYFDGESTFRQRKRPFVVSARYNASRPPFEFLVHNGENKLLMRFVNRRDIYQSRALQVLGKKTMSDEAVEYDLASLEEEFGAALSDLFSSP